MAVCSRHALIVALAMSGCSSEDSEPSSAPPPAETGCPPGEALLDDGRCLPAGIQPDGCAAGETMRDGVCVAAGVQDNGCPAGELLQDSRCVPAGVPPEACGQGFVSDGDGGCEAVLPSSACPDGTMAVPGETMCQPVASCGQGTWGDIPADSSTQYVDASYTGGSSDGSASQPWTTTDEAIAAAAPGAIVAVAAGSYGFTRIEDKPVRLWGRCPELVEFVGPADHSAAVLVAGGASGTEIRGIATTGLQGGVAVSGSDALVEDVWIHDVPFVGVIATPDFGPTNVTVRHALVERSTDMGVFMSGVHAVVEASAVRDGEAGSLADGMGLVAQMQGERSVVTVRGSLFERNASAGAMIFASDVEFVDTVVRDTRPDVGAGITAVEYGGEAASVTVRSSVLAGNIQGAIQLGGSDAVIETTVLRDTQPDPVYQLGHGVSAEAISPNRSTLALSQSLVDMNHNAGVKLVGADATLTGVLIRSTQYSSTPGGTAGVGVVVGRDPYSGERSNATIVASKIVDNLDSGVRVIGSDATIEGSVIADTRASPVVAPAGLIVQPGEGKSHVRVSTSVLEHNETIGVAVIDSDLSFESSVVRDTLAIDGEFGIGLLATARGGPEPSIVDVTRSVVEQSFVAGILVEHTQLTVESSAVRDTDVEPATNSLGDGILAQNQDLEGPASILTVNHSLVERARGAGIAVLGSQGSITSTLVRDALESTEQIGVAAGILIQAAYQPPGVPGSRSSVMIIDSAVDDCQQNGILAGGADVTVEHTLVRGTRAVRGLYGDAVVAGALLDTMLSVTRSRLETSARAALANFGSNVVLGSTVIDCNAIDIHGEPFGDFPFSFTNAGDNTCGCLSESRECKVLSTHLERPPALEPP